MIARLESLLAKGCFLPAAREHASRMLEYYKRKERMTMTVYLMREPLTQPCGGCMGNGCGSCKGTGEESVALEHWKCTSCLVEGEGDPGPECPSCGDDLIVEDRAPEPDDGFDPPDDDRETMDDMYGPEVF